MPIWTYIAELCYDTARKQSKRQMEKKKGGRARPGQGGTSEREAGGTLSEEYQAESVMPTRPGHCILNPSRFLYCSREAGVHETRKCVHEFRIAALTVRTSSHISSTQQQAGTSFLLVPTFLQSTLDLYGLYIHKSSTYGFAPINCSQQRWRVS